MAKAKKIEITVVKTEMVKETIQTVVVVPKKIVTHEPRVILELTEDEASFLSLVLSRIGGDPEISCRKYQVNISVALSALGINFQRIRDLPQFKFNVSRGSGIWCC